ncbi:MAG: HAD hydrolase-like protein [Phycisphaerales bacterium]|nr:HAD hydrolase-like protein [Phycisphaerales bacterium]
MLVLFDIDGTMLLTERAGVAAMLDAGRELFGTAFSFDGIEVAGRLDALIWSDLARRNNIDATEANHARFRATYGTHLARKLRDTHRATPLPGVVDLIDRMASSAGVTLGLLTGNYPETGREKIRSAGIDPDRFGVAAWGIDGPTRRDLPPVAMSRCQVLSGRAVRPEQVVIIGDTPHDVDCARHHGCRCLAVATGAFTVAELDAAGATRTVESLAATDDLASWILGFRAAPTS